MTREYINRLGVAAGGLILVLTFVASVSLVFAQYF